MTLTWTRSLYFPFIYVTFVYKTLKAQGRLCAINYTITRLCTRIVSPATTIIGAVPIDIGFMLTWFMDNKAITCYLSKVEDN